MKLFKRIFSSAALAAIITLSGCSAQDAVDAEIQVPVFEGASNSNFETATVEVTDIELTQNVGGSIGYAYSDTLYTFFESNLIEFNVKRGDILKEGDVIAVFDSSALDYDLTNQSILADDAYANYLATGSEAARLEYEIQKKQLELVQYQVDQFTIRAPYDCIVTNTGDFVVGSVVKYGKEVCTVAKEDEVYLYTSKSADLFHVGMAVTAKFGTNDEYKGNVVSVPESGAKNSRGSSSLNTSVVIKFEDGELERLIEEVHNVVSAGWATIIVPTVQKYNVMTLPEEAIAQFSGSTYCSILNNGLQVRIPVEVEAVYDGLAIIKNGLREGDEVVY